jgi:hypothetical protein
VNGVANTYRLQNGYSGMCMTVGGDRFALAPIEQTLCSVNDPVQRWILDEDDQQPDGAGAKVYHIFNAYTGYVLTANYGVFEEGAPLFQYRYGWDYDAQKWQMW